MKFHCTIVLTTAPDTPEGVGVTEGSASVRVSWQTVVDADRYIVTFSQVQGTDQQGLCPTDSHVASLIADSLSTTVSVAVGGDVESTVTDMLRAYTTYDVTVKAVSDRRGTSQPSETRRILTPQTSETHSGLWYHYCILCVWCAGPGEAPGNVRAEAVSSTEISVQWNGLSTCRLVNGLIVSYRVRITASDRVDVRERELRDGEDWRNGGDISLTGLTPSSSYSITVAAVNEKGDVGPYSDPVTIHTLQVDRGIQ